MNLPLCAPSSPNKDLESITREAMRKVNAAKETDLCKYIPYQDKALDPSSYLSIKSANSTLLCELIHSHILDCKPISYKTPTNETTASTLTLNECISKAMTLIDGKKEADICKYIPDDEGYLHHCAYFRIKRESPQRLLYLIKQNLLDKTPTKYPSKPRKAYQRQRSRSADLVEIIKTCMDKMAHVISKEEDLCRYIPGDNGFLHPVSYRSLKSKDPGTLSKLMDKHILEPEDPTLLVWNNASNAGGARSTGNYRNKKAKDPNNDRSNIEPSTMPITQKKEGKLSASPHMNIMMRLVQNQLVANILERKLDQELFDVYTELIQE